jgi:hypothetical protein
MLNVSRAGFVWWPCCYCGPNFSHRTHWRRSKMPKIHWRSKLYCRTPTLCQGCSRLCAPRLLTESCSHIDDREWNDVKSWKLTPLYIHKIITSTHERKTGKVTIPVTVQVRSRNRICHDTSSHQHCDTHLPRWKRHLPAKYKTILEKASWQMCIVGIVVLQLQWKFKVLHC